MYICFTNKFNQKHFLSALSADSTAYFSSDKWRNITEHAQKKFILFLANISLRLCDKKVYLPGEIEKQNQSEYRTNIQLWTADDAKK